jgi:C4-dicarboxylate-specific signal transduction histidine kinase
MIDATGTVSSVNSLVSSLMNPRWDEQKKTKTRGPRRWPKPPTVFSYTMAVLSVAVAIIAAELITRFLHAEAIASSMLCAVIFAAWFGGLGPALLAITLAIVAFHYYLVPPINSFTWKQDLFTAGISEVPRLILFSITSLFVAFTISAQRRTAEILGRSRDDLQGAIEDQKRIEVALRESEQRFRDYAETASDWLWETGPDHRFTRVSENHNVLDVLLANRIGAARWDFATDVESEPEKWRLHRAMLDAHKPFRDFVFSSVVARGSVIYFRSSGKPFFDARGNFLGYRGVSADITATIRADHAERALREAQAELAHVTRVTTLGEMTASIAHEVNQPLAAVVANAEACLGWLNRETPDLDAARRSVEWIINDSERASEVIRRIRALVNKTGVEKVPLDINDVVREVIVLVQRELISQGVSLRMELATALPRILGDRVQLQQVIINLVKNGIEAMQSVTDRPRELIIRSLRDETGQVLVSVTDRGVGISAENCERLFSAFFTTKPSGMGIGLSICRSIVEAHGGRLWASGNVGQGATFQFALLPLHQEDGGQVAIKRD